MHFISIVLLHDSNQDCKAVLWLVERRSYDNFDWKKAAYAFTVHTFKSMTAVIVICYFEGIG